MVVIGSRASSVEAEVDSSASTEAFASAVVNFAAIELWLGYGLVAPVVAGDDQGPVSLAECLMSFVFMCTSGIEK